MVSSEAERFAMTVAPESASCTEGESATQRSSQISAATASASGCLKPITVLRPKRILP